MKRRLRSGAAWAYGVVAMMASPLPAAADPHAVFHGSWGTEKQCTRALIKPGGTVQAAPVEIGPEWLKQGQVWCRLRWLPSEARGDGYFTAAHAQCGEDSVQDYYLRMELADAALTLRWDVLLAVGPLERCPN
ncbi:MAG: hypothetical protein AAF675_14620 [Pseudomonadota bacterium]